MLVLSDIISMAHNYAGLDKGISLTRETYPTQSSDSTFRPDTVKPPVYLDICTIINHIRLNSRIDLQSSINTRTDRRETHS